MNRVNVCIDIDVSCPGSIDNYTDGLIYINKQSDVLL